MQDWEGMDNISSLHKAMANGITIVTIVTIFVSCYCDYLLTNRAYLRTDIASGRVKSYFNRILSAAETTKDFNPDEGLVILGEFYYRNNPSSVEIDLFNSEDLRELSGVALENGLITSGVRDNFIETFVGYELADLTDKEKQAIMDTQEYKNMPIYPHEGCVEKIDGIWVVKLCD